MSLLCHLLPLYLLFIVKLSTPSDVHCDASGCVDSQDFLPWSNLTQLAGLEQTEIFTMKVFVLTMNRPESLTRLLTSISNTFFEYEGDRIELEIHVDKSHGNHTHFPRLSFYIHFPQVCCMKIVSRLPITTPFLPVEGRSLPR